VQKAWTEKVRAELKGMNMGLKGQTVSSLLNISKALERAVRDKEQRIHAVYPQVLPSLEDSEIGEDLMDPLGMALIASGDAYLRLANSLIDFLVTAGKGQLRPHKCALQSHFGLNHYHLDDIFHNYETVEFRPYYWEGYRGAALAQTREEARNLVKGFLSYDNLATSFDDLPPKSSMDRYDAARFITVADNIASDPSSSETADDRRLLLLSSSISELIQDQSARIYTLLGGGDDEILLYGSVDAFLRLAEGLVDFVLAARRYRRNQAHDKPLLGMDLRSLFDVAYSVNPMDTVCFADSEAEFEQARVFFRLE
jgi:hypothetical protein